jgi:hypothetical protein
MNQSENAVAVMEPRELAPLSATEIKRQVNLIQEVLQAVMQEGVHYGVIPGTDKPTLLKPGAEKICLTFRLGTELEVQAKDLGNGHREYTVTCSLRHLRSNELYGQGIGSCSTMESKYRWRRGEAEDTGKAVPKDYWDHFKTNPARAQDIIGGKGFITKKIDGQWKICKKSDERMENLDIADVYNTVLKMAKKRALVDATLTATAASDCFTQDLDEFPPETTQQTRAEPPAEKPLKTAPKPEEPDAVKGKVITESQVKLVVMACQRAGITDDVIHRYLHTTFSIPSRKEIQQADLNTVMKWIEEHGRKEETV